MISFRSLIPYWLHDAGQVFDDVFACEGVYQIGCAYLYGSSACQHHFDDIFCGGNTAHTDDGDVYGFRYLIYHANSTGKMALPEKPPILLAIQTFCFQLMRMPIMVLMRLMPSAPASSHAFATAAMSVSLGLSLM